MAPELGAQWAAAAAASCLCMQPVITSSAEYVVTHNPRPQFLLDFGQKVQQLDPLQLFNFTGSDRWAFHLFFQDHARLAC